MASVGMGNCNAQMAGTSQTYNYGPDLCVESHYLDANGCPNDLISTTTLVQWGWTWAGQPNVVKVLDQKPRFTYQEGKCWDYTDWWVQLSLASRPLPSRPLPSQTLPFSNHFFLSFSLPHSLPPSLPNSPLAHTHFFSLCCPPSLVLALALFATQSQHVRWLRAHFQHRRLEGLWVHGLWLLRRQNVGFVPQAIRADDGE